MLDVNCISYSFLRLRHTASSNEKKMFLLFQSKNIQIHNNISGLNKEMIPTDVCLPLVSASFIIIDYIHKQWTENAFMLEMSPK